LRSHSPPLGLASHHSTARQRLYSTVWPSCWNVRLQSAAPAIETLSSGSSYAAGPFFSVVPSAALFCLCGCLLFPVRPHHHHKRTAPETTSTLLPTDLRSCLVLSCLVSSLVLPRLPFGSKSPQSPRGATEGEKRERERKQEGKKSKLEETSRSLSHFLRGASAAWDCRREE